MVKISVDSLSEAALTGVIDDFVLREGTDYGPTETTLERKRAQVLAQLARGDAQIWFDPESQSVTITVSASETDPDLD